MISFSNIPTSLMIFLLIQAFWIIAFFGVIQHIIVKAIKNEHWRDLVEYYTPLVSNIAWILFSIKVIYHLANINPVVSLAVIGVILALGWQSIRDFIQGTIFRFQKGDITGQSLKVKDYSGIVKKLGNTKIELITNQEELIQIPYSHIISAVTTKPTAAKHLKTANILVDIPEGSSVEIIKSKIKEQLFNMPWVVSSKGIKIEKHEEEDQLKVSFSTLNTSYINKVKGLLADAYS